MQKKAAVLLGGAAIALAGLGWFGMSVLKEIRNEPGSSISGQGLHIDVVAPTEPAPVQSSGQLGVGDLNNGYDHSQAMAAPDAAENSDDYARFDDGSWNAETGTGLHIEDKRVYSTEPKVKSAMGTDARMPEDY